MVRVNLEQFKRIKAIAAARKSKRAQKRVEIGQIKALIPSKDAFVGKITPIKLPDPLQNAQKCPRTRRNTVRAQTDSSDPITGPDDTIKPRKRPKSKTNSQIESIYWDVFSFYIRLRDKRANNGLCFYCGSRPIECAMHRIKRGKRATKYDERNVDGGCHTCNNKDRFWPQEFDATFIRKKGAPLFLELETLSRQECARSRVDMIEKTEFYREKTRLLLVTSPTIDQSFMQV